MTAVFLVDDPDVLRMLRGQRVREGGRPVRGSVVHDQDIHLFAGGNHAFHTAAEKTLHVIAGNHQGQ